MEWQWLVLGLFLYTPLALLVFAPACAALARARNRDAETWLLLGAVGGPVALAWIAASARRPRPNDADSLQVSTGKCLLCGSPLRDGHACQPEAVEDRIQRRWTVRIGGQRIIGPP